MKNDDIVLFDAWQAGDRSAGEALIARYYDAIDGFFRYKMTTQHGDLVQRTFLACVEAAPRFKRKTSFKAFLFGIARNVLYEGIRGKVRDQRLDLDFGLSALCDLAPGASTLRHQDAERRLLVDALKRIPLELQVLLELYYWEDLGVRELAEVLELPAGTVKSRLFRARKLLKEALEDLPVDNEEKRTAAALVASWADAARLAGPLVESDAD